MRFLLLLRQHPQIPAFLISTLLVAGSILLGMYITRMASFFLRVLHRLTHRIRVRMKMTRFYLVNWLTRMTLRLYRTLTRLM